MDWPAILLAPLFAPAMAFCGSARRTVWLDLCLSRTETVPHHRSGSAGYELRVKARLFQISVKRKFRIWSSRLVKTICKSIFSGLISAQTNHCAINTCSKAPTKIGALPPNNEPSIFQICHRAINEDGLISEKPAVVSFKLLPPIWQRWWFVLGVAIILVGSVITLDRFRVRKTRQVKVALKQTTESETRYRTLAETASDAIVTIDENSKIIYANEAAEHVFGYRA